MSGAVKAAIVIGLTVVVVMAINIRLYRTARAATARGRALQIQPGEDRRA